MLVTKNDISEILGMYEKYCKALELLEPDKLPPLTLNEQEYQTALIDPIRYKSAKKTIKKALGQTAQAWRNYRQVVFIDIKKMKYLKGLHEYSEPQLIVKETKKYIKTYRIREKIPHLEETLIHELVHVKYPHLRHGDRFNQIIRNIYERYNSD